MLKRYSLLLFIFIFVACQQQTKQAPLSQEESKPNNFVDPQFELAAEKIINEFDTSREYFIGKNDYYFLKDLGSKKRLSDFKDFVTNHPKINDEDKEKLLQSIQLFKDSYKIAADSSMPTNSFIMSAFENPHAYSLKTREQKEKLITFTLEFSKASPQDEKYILTSIEKSNDDSENNGFRQKQYQSKNQKLKQFYFAHKQEIDSNPSLRNSFTRRLAIETKGNFLCSERFFIREKRTLFNILLRPEEEGTNSTLDEETLNYIKDYQEVVDYQLSKYGWISGSYRGKRFGYFSYPVKDFEVIKDPNSEESYRTVAELLVYLSRNVARNSGAFDFSKFHLLTITYSNETSRKDQSLEDLVQRFKASKDKEKLQAPQILAAYLLTEFKTEDLTKPTPKEIRLDMNKKWLDLENRHLRFLESNELQHLELLEQIRNTDSSFDLRDSVQN